MVFKPEKIELFAYVNKSQTVTASLWVLIMVANLLQY